MGLWRTRWFDPVLDTLPRRKHTTLATLEQAGAIVRVVCIEDPFGPKSYVVIRLVESTEGEPYRLDLQAVIGEPTTQRRWDMQSGTNRSARRQPDENDCNEPDGDEG